KVVFERTNLLRSIAGSVTRFVQSIIARMPVAVARFPVERPRFARIAHFPAASGNFTHPNRERGGDRGEKMRFDDSGFQISDLKLPCRLAIKPSTRRPIRSGASNAAI